MPGETISFLLASLRVKGVGINMHHENFVHLHLHTQYSLLDGACFISKLMELAHQCRMPAIAMTDHGNLFGTIEFYDEAMKHGIKPIIGCEIYVAPTDRRERVTHSLHGTASHLILLAKDETGYRNLMKLVTAGYLEGFYYKPRIDKELLRQYGEGLIGLSSCLKGEIPRYVSGGQREKAREAALSFKEMFKPGDFYLELQDHHLPEQTKVNEALVSLGRELGIPLCATNDVHYLHQKDAKAHDALLCIQTQTTLEDPHRMRYVTPEFYFKTPQEMTQIFKDLPEAIRSTIEIAEKCNLELDFTKTHLPSYVPPQGKTGEEYLRELCYDGLRKRYGGLDERLTERVEHELAVIKNAGFTSYFLVTWDFVHYAKGKGIPVGPGRGSVAGSLASYALGITDIDPLKYDLLFERFLNPDRVSLPDIDIDFCYERRGEVIDYVNQKYGSQNVAQIITFGTMQARAVVRDVGRVMNMPYPEVDRIAKLIPNELNITLKEAIEQEPELKKLADSDPKIAQLLETSLSLEGLTRHASTHAAGVVVSDQPLTEYMPLFKSSDNQVTTGYDMKSLEKIGLLKIDFLGLRTLTVIEETLKLIQGETGKNIDWNRIPLDDATTYRLLANAETIGVFQLESSGMRDLLKKMGPTRFEDIVALLALFRPGPIGSGMVDDFISRKHTPSLIRYDDPRLEPILKETYGIIVYQEQVMRIASALGGLTLSQADSLRRAMAKKEPETMERMRRDFVEGAVKNGASKRIAEKVFNLIEYFSGYGFNKCVVGETEIVDAETGRPLTVEELYRNRRPLSTFSIDKDLRLVKRRVRDVVSNGVKPVFKVNTALGHSITVTDNHPFLTLDGWKELKALKAGDFIAAPRSLQYALTAERRMEPYQLIVLSAILSEGNTCHPSGVYCYNNNKAFIEDFVTHVSQFEETWPTVRRRGRQYEVYAGTGRQTTFAKAHIPWNKGRFGYSRRGVHGSFPEFPRSGVRRWIEALGLAWTKSTEKFIPEPLFSLPDDQLALFVGRLWSGDGHLWTTSGAPLPFYATSSRRLAYQVQQCLLRLSLISTVKEKEFSYRKGSRLGYVVYLSGKAQILRFIDLIGPHMVGKDETLERLRSYYDAVKDDQSSKDIIPSQIKFFVRSLKERLGLTWRQLEKRSGVCMRDFYGREKFSKHGFRRSTIRRLGEYLEAPELLCYATSDLYWDRIVSIEASGTRETYDIEIEETHNFIANSLIVHNSHSAAYAMISYRTAYLKAHYPVEFMTALLTSEKDNTDKIVQYTNEATRMGIKILPPSVNESFAKFTKTPEGSIRFGLFAVKNVGLGAIESILESRKTQGPFQSFLDFCERMDLRLVNRKVIESLIKCGALDGLHLYRSQLMAMLDQTLEAASRRQRDRQGGQLSFLDVFGESHFGKGDPPPPPLKEWPETQRLAFERELLGFYVTGHPLSRYEKLLRVYSTPTSLLQGCYDGEVVCVGGILSKVRLTTTKRLGEKMAILTLEDLEGSVEVLVFPSTFNKSYSAIKEGGIVFVKGRANLKEETPKLIAEDIVLAEEAKEKLTGSIILHLQTAALEESMVKELREILARYSGNIPLYLNFKSQNRKELRVLVNQSLFVSLTPAFEKEVERIAGEGVIEFTSQIPPKKILSPPQKNLDNMKEAVV